MGGWPRRARDRRIERIDCRLAIAIGRHAARPAGLEQLAACGLRQ
jgi:hypothetical protein